jgi:hypothetical protein
MCRVIFPARELAKIVTFYSEFATFCLLKLTNDVSMKVYLRGIK